MYGSNQQCETESIGSELTLSLGAKGKETEGPGTASVQTQTQKPNKERRSCGSARNIVHTLTVPARHGFQTRDLHQGVKLDSGGLFPRLHVDTA
jgi:hypothetical protein